MYFSNFAKSSWMPFAGAFVYVCISFMDWPVLQVFNAAPGQSRARPKSGQRFASAAKKKYIYILHRWVIMLLFYAHRIGRFLSFWRGLPVHPTPQAFQQILGGTGPERGGIYCGMTCRAGETTERQLSNPGLWFVTNPICPIATCSQVFILVFRVDTNLPE